jgi:uncharacterized membrane protein
MSLHDDRGVWISKGRFEAFSDGVFAIAITLLVLGFAPPKLAVVSEPAMFAALRALWPQYLVYFASFATIGIMWFNHYALFHHATRVSYAALIANLGLLLFVCFLPFPTALLGQYALVPAAVFFYGATLFGIALCFNVLGYVATLRQDQRGSVLGLLRTRNFWNTGGLVVYAFGSALAFYSPVASIALFGAIAVYYMSPSTVRSTLILTAAAHGDGQKGSQGSQ